MKTIAIIAATTTAGLCAAYPLYPRSGASQCADTPPPPTQEVVAKPTPPPPAAPKKAAAPCTSPRTVAGATVTLKDGSVLKGELLSQKIVGNAIFRSDLALPVDIVKSVAFKGKGGEAKVELVNKDAFTMTIVDKSYKVKSTLGDLDVPCASIRQLSLSSRKACGDAEDGLVFHCTFDDRDSITTPAVGPKGTFLRGEFMQGKVGMAMQTTVYSQNATFDLPADFFNTSGCIEFWAKIQKPSSYIGNGGDPRLFTITQKSTNNTISTLDIVSNNGGGNSGFSTWTFLGNMASIRGCRSLRYEDLFPTSNFRDWHHYAIIWDKDGISDLTGTPRMALLVDGKFIPDIQNHVRSAEAAAALISTPMRLSFTHDPNLDPELSTKSPFLIDEFKIWSYAKTNFNL